MNSGIATFNTLTFTTLPDDRTAVLTFTAGSQGSTTAAGCAIVSGPITVVPVSNSYLRYAPTDSWITRESQQRTTSTGVTLPTIRIQLVDSTYKSGGDEDEELDVDVDTSHTGLIITASNAGGSVTSVVTAGVATFSGLQSTGGSGLTTVTFTAGTTPTLPVNGQTLTFKLLITGSPLGCANLIFGPVGALLAQGETIEDIMIGVELPSITVSITDSAHVIDTSVSSTTIRVSTPASNGQLAGALTAVTHRGSAVFTGIKFTSVRANGKARLVFSTKAECVVDGQSITSGHNDVHGSGHASMRFRA
eukprot:gene219-11636_t